MKHRNLNSPHQMTVHHRKPQALGGTGADRNISEIERKYHEAWHTLFDSWNPELIAATINEVYLDPDYEFVVRKK